jgi:secreted Zn-dependent insulinase-like peptidase
LIAEGYALELSSSFDHELQAISAFEINITLTKKGLQEYEKVIESVFRYA